MSRPAASLTSRLTRLGFVDAERAAAHVERLGPHGPALLPLVAASAEPDLCARYLAALAERCAEVGDHDLLPALEDDEGCAMRILTVLGASPALGDHLLRHPDHWRDLCDPAIGSTRMTAWWMRDCLVRAVGADPDDAEPVSTLTDAEACDALRVAYRRLLLLIAARDLAHHVRVDDVAAELSDLAAATLEAALAVARAAVGESRDRCRLAVIAMGKCGGRELNYVSDVDVIFVAEPVDDDDEPGALRVATQLASNLIRVCSDHTAEGTIWPVDAALRPEGKAGALVRTLSSHQGYYERWASTWEFQALLKARHVAGDAELGAAYVETITPMVWSAVERDNFVSDVQAMRRRVVDNLRSDEADRQIKLGPGGLRDVEFAVQLLQLVHGRADERIRLPTTLSALTELTRGGYVGREDGAALEAAYMFLRTLEHRLQLHRLRRTHTVPDDAEEMRHLGRAMGFRRQPVEQLEAAWRTHAREVRRLHEKLFYRPLLGAVAALPGEGARLAPDAAKQRLAALGYADPEAAFRHLEAMTGGVSRSAAIRRQLLPVMLGWFADAPDPDAGLAGFRKVSEALGSTHWYLRRLRDEGQTASRLAQLLGTSRYATDLMMRAPEAVAMLGDEGGLLPRSRELLVKESVDSGRRQASGEDGIAAVRAVRRRELFRISAADLTTGLPVERVGEALTDVTVAALEGALAVAQRVVAESRGRELTTRMAIVAMGRFGGAELSYGSDADVMFVHDPLDGADAETAAGDAKAVANELRRLLAIPGTDPELEVDADLRPEGRQGPLVRSLSAYAAYYAKWSAVWEAQALLRAEAMIGDADLCARFTALIDPLRFPAGGLTDDDIREVRRIKARVDDERLPRGADRATHLKLGRGALADIEWTVQLLQMRYAGSVPGLRTTRTLAALDAAVEAELISAPDAADLAAAWTLVSRMRNAITQVRGKPSDHLPRDGRERAAVSLVIGYGPEESDVMANDHLRATRRARAVVERVFWG
ncbi:bifunctional [glutamine synthetase] adenylyltransferase/[glutamine synthetase]-adenylyl-L-tyrosine phosphorylase [Nocardioides massiliensis]|uniref:Bifunctional glutamine synthetase adenylyltransferase/adenylyl-removing enzyme n=1 Tax=Nocardioides massiliensis TaxID=1325935 RepID=A0ABT9NTJ4_9ACTN|nr:bifunctional [glutamine synthetase] adenylyltransferase/[glutamine synthetase]-adenylyl-L-tyrosine phosphorylase [Nocardioides massiliensis]MDP9823748.1 glutamate-ammonia-ligase adenylyltransferase [Nocardioides massiliensis]